MGGSFVAADKSEITIMLALFPLFLASTLGEACRYVRRIFNRRKKPRTIRIFFRFFEMLRANGRVAMFGQIFKRKKETHNEFFASL